MKGARLLANSMSAKGEKEKTDEKPENTKLEVEEQQEENNNTIEISNDDASDVSTIIDKSLPTYFFMVCAYSRTMSIKPNYHKL